MKWLKNFRNAKYVLIAVAAVIATASLWVSNLIVEDLKQEEERRMAVWASAMTSLINAEVGENVSLENEILTSNKTIPVVMMDKVGNIISHNNIQESKLERVAAEMRATGSKIEVPLGDDEFCYIYYDDSATLVQLSYYPYIQLAVVVLFFIICIVAVLSSKRAEQNRVWVGLSKETAHQLGTPISSLMAWIEVLKAKYADDELLPEMERDVQRLQMVADRFSKIGSRTEPVPEDVSAVVGKAVEYMKRRSPAKVKYNLSFPDASLSARLNVPLMEWVFENLCKNAIDAMEGSGEISVVVADDGDKVLVDVTDTGKGIAKSRWKMIFEPGFTTKPRGWGLGLSLAKRIVEEFHKGRIYIKKSLPGKGTTFRIELKK
ncbi:MAG: HAMP domain-containing histidine kinase [Bacteroidaceae bacterium]|nr:HAMP domain-containing histidine kinase [Bacteroidaceae bacterium]